MKQSFSSLDGSYRDYVVYIHLHVLLYRIMISPFIFDLNDHFTFRFLFHYKKHDINQHFFYFFSTLFLLLLSVMGVLTFLATDPTLKQMHIMFYRNTWFHYIYAIQN